MLYVSHRGPDDAGLGLDATKEGRYSCTDDYRSSTLARLVTAHGQRIQSRHRPTVNFIAIELRTLLEKRGHQFRTETEQRSSWDYTKNTGSTFFLILMGCLPSAWGQDQKFSTGPRSMGIKPLFLLGERRWFHRFGSEINSLLARKKSTTPSICTP